MFFVLTFPQHTYDTGPQYMWQTVFGKSEQTHCVQCNTKALSVLPHSDWGVKIAEYPKVSTRLGIYYEARAMS